MKMKPQVYALVNWQVLIWVTIGMACMAWLLTHKLAFLTGGLSASEIKVAHDSLGWHGIYHNPFGLPLEVARSIVFYLFPDHGQLLTRLPNVFFGALSVVTFAWLVRLWHGTKPAVLAMILFATSAWVLHVSRLASSDVLYLWATPTLLIVQVGLHKRATQPLIWYGSVIVWGLCLYIPGLVWLILLSLYLQRQHIRAGWKHFALWWQRLLYALACLIWLPLLVINLTRHGQLSLWLGLPSRIAAPLTLLKQFAAVPVHLFVRGPQYPDIWLARLPILDAFTLVACLIGILFYARQRQVARGRLLGLFLVAGTVLIGLGGPVSLSLLVPILYIMAGTGIAYLLHEWLHVFPVNPIARNFGIGIIIIAVGLSSIYNLRSYFVAWPHNGVTRSVFQYHP